MMPRLSRSVTPIEWWSRRLAVAATLSTAGLFVAVFVTAVS